VRFLLNGRWTEAPIREGTSLLEVLREGCGITSVKDGCSPEGSCGACTVLVDGRAVVSCAQRAGRAEGRSVTTLEGLLAPDRERWVEAFVAAGAAQCGFCTPGMVMKAEGLLARKPQPTRGEIARALAGNLCRCTGYLKIIDAIGLAVAARRGGSIPAPDRSGRVGTRAARYEGPDLALGRKPFVGDLRVPGMLHAALRFADHPRARVLCIDTSRARSHPQVVSVLTWRDVPGERRQGLIVSDWPQLVAEGELTSYVGDIVAAVAAETRKAAREGAAKVGVEYEVLEPVTDPFDALHPGAPRVHEDADNLLSVSIVRRGDVAAALRTAAHAVTETFRTQRVEHGFLEPESALAVLAGPGGVGGPAPDRVAARAARTAGPGDPGVHGWGLRRQGGPVGPGPRGAARQRHPPAGHAHALAR